MTDTNPRAVIGGNNPPPEPREAIALNVADLIEQVEGAAFGQQLETQEQADAVGGLLGQVKDAMASVTGQADAEKEPHKKAVAEIDEWRNGYNAKGLKKTPDGSLTKAETVLSNQLAGWLKKQNDDRKERERLAAIEAAKLAQEAIEARKEALQSTDLQALDSAEDMLAAAKAAIGAADKLAKDKPRVEVEGRRAFTAKATYTAKVTNYAAAYGHYKHNPQFMADFHTLIDKWAQSDARSEAARHAGIAGVEFTEGVRV